EEPWSDHAHALAPIAGANTGNCSTMKKLRCNPPTLNLAAKSWAKLLRQATKIPLEAMAALPNSITGRLFPTPLNGSTAGITVRSFVALVMSRRPRNHFFDHPLPSAAFTSTSDTQLLGSGCRIGS